MATSSDDMKSEFNYRRYQDGDRDQVLNENIWQASWTHKCPTYVNRTPPCQGSCPSGHDIRGWLDIVRGVEKPVGEGVEMQEYAFRRATNANPFPSVMGRVCPAPCEDGCNRNMVDDFVGINSVEQYIGDSALANNYSFVAGEATGKKVAIIGGGPGGIACAYQLRRMGHSVTIFDNNQELGGMIRYGIPGYRMPREILDGEIKRIIDMGVDVKNNTKVGKDVALTDIEKEFDAIVFAMGAQMGRNLPIPGADANNVIPGVAFLAAFNQGRLKHVSGKIVVIGGGDTSIDVASVARRLGHITVENEKDRPEHIIAGQTAHDVAESAAREGADVTLITRSSIENMPAAEHEIIDAKREGIEIIGQLSPVEVMKDANGRATGLKVIRLEADGKTPIEGTEYVIEAELIVPAIGQGGDWEGLEGFSNERGLAKADKNFQVPGKEGFFAIGDIIQPHLLTTAIGHASVAADSINHYLSGLGQEKRPKIDVHHFNLLNKLRETNHLPEEYHSEDRGGDPTMKPIDVGLRGTSESNWAVHNYDDRSAREVIPADELFLGHFAQTPRNKRSQIEVTAEDVIGNFQERLVALTEAEVVSEAKRCMSCGMCFECDNCIIYCPQDAVKKTPKAESTTGRYVYTDYSRCIGCHICADVCPTGYIDMGMGDG